MAEEFPTEVVKRFTVRDRVALEQGLGAPDPAQTLNPHELTEHAFDTLMDVETLIFETTALLNSVAIINRSEQGEERSD
jgi:hypothetical protein